MYNKWCTENSFESKLPKAVHARKDVVLAAARAKQPSLNSHLTAKALEERVIAIMVLSVSSERAFLAAGITILKHWNRLKGDIVKALEFLKALYVRDLIFHDLPTSVTEEKLDVFE